MLNRGAHGRGWLRCTRRSKRRSPEAPAASRRHERGSSRGGVVPRWIWRQRGCVSRRTSRWATVVAERGLSVGEIEKRAVRGANARDDVGDPARSWRRAPRAIRPKAPSALAPSSLDVGGNAPGWLALPVPVGDVPPRRIVDGGVRAIPKVNASRKSYETPPPIGCHVAASARRVEPAANSAPAADRP
jgi:hypothetical protein